MVNCRSEIDGLKMVLIFNCNDNDYVDEGCVSNSCWWIVYNE